jgi:hypothetical protein
MVFVSIPQMPLVEVDDGSYHGGGLAFQSNPIPLGSSHVFWISHVYIEAGQFPPVPAFRQTQPQ